MARVKYEFRQHGTTRAMHRVPAKWNATRRHRVQAAANRARRRNNGCN